MQTLAENLSLFDEVIFMAVFWHDMRPKYQQLFDAVLTKVLPFSTTYLCEKGFPVFNSIKIKHQSRVHTEADLITTVKNLEPCIYLLLD